MSPEKMAIRAERCVCKMCGGSIEPRIIIYNRYGGSGMELYCPQCEKIEYGTEPEIYNLAKEFIDELEFNYFTEMEEDMRHYQLNIAKICEVLSWIMARTEVLSEQGIHHGEAMVFKPRSNR